MTLNTSLRSRVRRLELRQTAADRPSVAELLRSARARHLAMTPVEAAVHDLKRVDEGVDLLAMPAPADPIGARVDRMRRNFACRHLAAMASLDEPDLPKPDATKPAEYDLQAGNAWFEQQQRRRQAREYLATVETARGHYTPRHWPQKGQP